MEQMEGKSYRVLLEGGEGEIVEKKSRFIANIRRCENEAEAVSFIEEMKKKYWDARHNCSAMVIGAGGELTRCSDDGEPSGTAGRPMLEVLLGEGIRNICVVVTRYFGGTLLGTGGLVRAYTQAVQAALQNCTVGRMRLGRELEIQTDYNGVGKIQYILDKYEIQPVDTLYTDTVTFELQLPAEDVVRLQRVITEATSGRAQIHVKDEVYFVDKEKSRG